MKLKKRANISFSFHAFEFLTFATVKVRKFTFLKYTQCENRKLFHCSKIAEFRAWAKRKTNISNRFYQLRTPTRTRMLLEYKTVYACLCKMWKMTVIAASPCASCSPFMYVCECACSWRNPRTCESISLSQCYLVSVSQVNGRWFDAYMTHGMVEPHKILDEWNSLLHIIWSSLLIAYIKT